MLFRFKPESREFRVPTWRNALNQLGQHKNTPERYKFVAAKDNIGQRLDAFLAGKIPAGSISRSRIKALLLEGHITVNDAFAKPSYRLRPGDRVAVNLPSVTPVELLPEKVDFQILFEDENLIVISKPPGLVVHPACGHQSGTLVHGLLFHCDDLSGISGEERPGIVHRLDKDTSGAMVVAKNDHAHQSLLTQFKDRQVTKIYQALADGIPAVPSGRFELPIGRHPFSRRKMAIAERQGRPAVTNWQLLEAFPQAGLSLLELSLETGRTHQIRVHLANAGYPVAGDEVYGRKNRKLYEGLRISRQNLHSSKLGFTHPVSGEALLFTAPLWSDMVQTLGILRGGNETDA